MKRQDKNYPPACVGLIISALLFLMLGGPLPPGAAAARAATMVAGLPAAEALRLGEAMYLQGMLPSGKAMEAIVQGDLVVEGTMVTCANCHMRSGLGSYEGFVLTLPTNGAKLYAPLQNGEDIPGGMTRGPLNHPRPAYNDESLAKVLRSGVDPLGRTLSPSMPRYDLDDREMEILIYYLKNLSSQLAPGVDDNVIRVATIVTDDVSPGDRAALIEPLKAYIQQEWNDDVPTLARVQRDTSYRTLALDVWELKGPADTWTAQLEALYRQQPVFALLGGISPKKWSPIHQFCERQKIPCIFPLTDLPELTKGDWYTLYFSKGYYQESAAAAHYLARVLDLPKDKEIVQVFRDDDKGKALARGFAEVWQKLGKATLRESVVPAKARLDANFWSTLGKQHKNAVLLLWLAPDDLGGIERLGELPERPAMVFVSATMLANNLAAIPEKIRDLAFITYPHRLPGEQEYVQSIVGQWLDDKQIPLTNMAITSKVYFLTRMVSKTLLAMRGNVYRDYFLDLFDTAEDKYETISGYPRISFGPGQRYGAKGCYVVTMGKGPQPKIMRQSDWIIY